jgi:hypothetical protein
VNSRSIRNFIDPFLDQSRGTGRFQVAEAVAVVTRSEDKTGDHGVAHVCNRDSEGTRPLWAKLFFEGI